MYILHESLHTNHQYIEWPPQGARLTSLIFSTVDLTPCQQTCSALQTHIPLPLVLPCRVSSFTIHNMGARFGTNGHPIFFMSFPSVSVDYPCKDTPLKSGKSLGFRTAAQGRVAAMQLECRFRNGVTGTNFRRWS